MITYIVPLLLIYRTLLGQRFNEKYVINTLFYRAYYKFERWYNPH